MRATIGQQITEAVANLSPEYRQALDHWREVATVHAGILDFVAWCERAGIEFDFGTADPSLPDDVRGLVDRFLNVDQDAVERARRALLGAED
jgi:alpha-L-arabinofuranosidase